ncbi:MAG: outer membrane protein assembly factor BamD [Pseudomonadota bacterium]|nr:outer membrane protein assembly factor BamD [Pseudomonadota bacterium]
MNMVKKIKCLGKVFSVAIFGCVILTGCEGTRPEIYIERPVEDIYNIAMDYLLDGDYEDAGSAFEEVERQHPYSVWSTKAQVMAAYAFYMDNDYDAAVIAAERFISLHPGNEDASYALYLVGLCYYEQISDIGRDQGMTELALSSFETVIRRFPGSSYAKDARLKIGLARDHLAGKEMEIGRTYQSLELYVAAINRFRKVVESYQTTSHVPEALHRLAESYLALGLIGEAESAAAVLGHNFGGSEWYESSYRLLRKSSLEPRLSRQSWLSRFF